MFCKYAFALIFSLFFLLSTIEPKAMISDEENNEKNKLVKYISYSLPSLALPDELWIKIMGITGKMESRPHSTYRPFSSTVKYLAPVSKYFHRLSCYQELNRTLVIFTPIAFQEIMKTRNPSGQYKLPLPPNIELYDNTDCSKHINCSTFKVHTNNFYIEIIKNILTHYQYVKVEKTGRDSNHELIDLSKLNKFMLTLKLSDNIPKNNKKPFYVFIGRSNNITDEWKTAINRARWRLYANFNPCLFPIWQGNN